MKNEKYNVRLSSIIEKIESIEKKNDQSVSFVIHGDGSGCFEDFWSEEEIIRFDNLDELRSVLITDQ